MTDVLYVAWNRLEYTRASFTALLANTDWDQVATLYVHDDGSTDGTRGYLFEALADVSCELVVNEERLGSPVAAMNWYLDQPSESSAFVKIDNDFVVCPGWLEETHRLAHLNPGVDAIGIAPWEGPPVLHVENGDRSVLGSSHIGGIGLIRRRAFERCRPAAKGRYGWTEYQHSHDWLRSGWMKPDMPCFELDRLPVEPWMDLARRYVANGWGREWPCYAPESSAYWSWWL